jgi:hypothetical protein
MTETKQATEQPNFIPFPVAMRALAERLQATPEELAAWIWFGPEDGGLAAYTDANELSDPPRFYYSYGYHDYIAPLMACWFRHDDIMRFVPQERFMTGKQLMDRWSKVPYLRVESYISAKIGEGMLMDFHPVTGSTQWTVEDAPPREIALFLKSHVENVEREEGISLEFAQSSMAAQSVSDASLGEPGAEQQRNDGAATKFSRRQAQVDEIVATINRLEFDPLRIPYGGKGKIRDELVKPGSKLFTPSAFDRAWISAIKQGLVEVENVDQYRKHSK